MSDATAAQIESLIEAFEQDTQEDTVRKNLYRNLFTMVTLCFDEIETIQGYLVSEYKEKLGFVRDSQIMAHSKIAPSELSHLITENIQHITNFPFYELFVPRQVLRAKLNLLYKAHFQED